MGESHSEYEGKEAPLVTSSEVFDNYYARIKLCLPLNFDFKKDGAKLLRNIESAVNLFFEKAQES